jgi:RhtB (resistance to homoserine/threonine) family protein
MEYLSLFGLVFIIHLLAVMSPGPDFIMVLKNALQYNRKTAVYTALGISLGIAVHIFYSVVGFALVLKNNTYLFSTLKIVGALYIIYIGYKTFKSIPYDLNLNTNNQPKQIQTGDALKTGFFTNVTNPKASLFFLSLFSVVVPSETPFHIIFLLGLMLSIVTFLWFVLVSVVFTNPLIVKAYQKYENKVLKILGGILIVLGISIFIEMLFH